MNKRRKSKNFAAILVLILTVCLIFDCVSIGAFAAKKNKNKVGSNIENIIANDNEPDVELDEKLQDKESEELIVGEEESLRDENTKHFRLADGSFVAAHYDYPVHVFEEENEEWIDIDNTLVFDAGTDTYFPKSSVLDIQFANSSVDEERMDGKISDELVSFGDGTHTVSGALFQGEKLSEIDEFLDLETTISADEYLQEDTSPDTADHIEQEGFSSINLEGAASEEKLEFEEPEGEMAVEETVVYDEISESLIEVESPEILVHGKNFEFTQSKSISEQNEEFLSLEKLTSSAYYRGILPGVDLEYILLPEGFKENIILNNANTQRTFKFVYDIKDLKAVQLDEKTIVLLDEKDDEVYRITAPLMFDANEEESCDVYLSILEVTNGKLLTELSVDEAWLNDADRAYPVTIDPYVQTKQSTAAGHKSGSYYQNSSAAAASARLYVGRNTAYQECRSYIRYELPELPAGSIVTNATSSLLQDPVGFGENASGTSPLQVNVCNVTSIAWSSSPFTKFTTAPTHETTCRDYVSTSSSTNGSVHNFDITHLVKGWYKDPSTNKGIALVSNEPSTSKVVFFVSSYSTNGYGTARPILTVSYLDSKGLESRWTTHDQSGGSAGTGYVNDYTGNLTFVSPLTSTNGANMPVSTALVYNGFNSLVNPNPAGRLNAGKGWSFSWLQRIETITSGTNLYTNGFRYKYVDSDGTEHYLKTTNTSNKFEDEEGLNLTLTKHTANSAGEEFTLTSKDGSKLTFTGSGILLRVYNSIGKYQQLNYNGAVLSKITDGSGRVTTITTDPSDNTRIKTVKDPAGRITTLGYSSSGYLTSISYPDGTISIFSYSGDKLSNVTSSDGSKLIYTYKTSTIPMIRNQVVYAGQRGNDGASIGNSVTFLYNNDNSTTFTDNQGRSETYQFNAVGQTISVTDSDGGGTYSYTPNDGSKKSNRISSASYGGKAGENLISNSSFESGLTSWSISSSTNPPTVDTGAYYLGAKAAKISLSTQGTNALLYDYAAVSGKTFTLSTYVKTQNIASTTNRGVAVRLRYLNSSKALISYTIGEYLTGTNDWQRISVTGTTPANTAYIRVDLLYYDATGIAWFDCVQLEEGAAINDYNMLYNGSFSIGDAGWSKANLTSNDKVYSSSGVYNYGIYGNPTTDKNINQTIQINKPAKKAGLLLSGTANGNSVSIKSGRWFSLYLRYVYSDGTSEYKSVKFNPQTYGKQSATGAVYPSEANYSKHVNYVVFYAMYYKQMNIVFFDDLQMTFDETGVEFTYDDKGNVTKAVDHLGRIQTAAYNSNNLTTSQSNYDGTGADFVYTSTHNSRLIASQRLKKSLNKTEYSYDTNGNVISTKTYDTNSSGTQVGDRIETSQTYNSGTNAGNYVTQSKNSRGLASNFEYDLNKGTLLKTTDPMGNVQKNTYNANNDKVLTVTANDKLNQATVLAKNGYQYNGKGYLEKINSGLSGEQTYSFVYDVFGNQTNVKVGTQNLITNRFKSNNGVLENVTYGNGNYVDYLYDVQQKNITSIKHNGITTVSNTYDKQGRLVSQTDTENNVTTKFYFDAQDRLNKTTDSKGNSIRTEFDESIAKANKTLYNIAGQKWEISQTYSLTNENAPAITTFPNSAKSQLHYDDLMRVKNLQITRGTDIWKNEFTFLSAGTGKTTTIPSSLSMPNYQRITGSTQGRKIDYTYDNNGRIQKIKDNTAQYPYAEITYHYDQLGQLVREQKGNANAGYDSNYYYDNRGNLTEKTVESGYVYKYEYGDSNWKDKLTKYDGKAITYDAIGNPKTYDGWTFTWQKGRQLKSMVKTGSNLSFKYDPSGLRTEKTVNGTTTKYYYEGSQLIAMQKGSEMPITFYYDATGKAVFFRYQSSGFYYVYNVQGDVIALTEINTVNGSSVFQTVCEYTYDPWGRLVEIRTNPAYTKYNPTTIANLNPLRYRGYVYDNETKLYYLQSRYYNPEWGRFINADGIIGANGDVISQNLFAYCSNNPVNFSDPSGMCSQCYCAPQWKQEKLLANCMSKKSSGGSGIIGGVGLPESATIFTKQQEKEILILAQTIYGEGGGRYVYPNDWKRGLDAVATVIYNRSQSPKFPNNFSKICTSGEFDGYTRGKKMYEDEKHDEKMWDYATEIAGSMVNGTFIPSLGADYLFFHSSTAGNNTTINRIKNKPEMQEYGGNMFYINYP